MNKRIYTYLMVCSLLTLIIGGCCHPSASESLAVTLHPQETTHWCWAASGQMVMDYLGHDVSQCVQANNRFGRNDCCNTPTPNACINGGWPEFPKYGFTSKKTSNAALSWERLREEISTNKYCEKKPFCFTWAWNGGGGHMMVAIGYKTVGGQNYVEVNDPGPANVGDHVFETYQAYVSGATYSHWHDYYDVTYVGD